MLTFFVFQTPLMKTIVTLMTAKHPRPPTMVSTPIIFLPGSSTLCPRLMSTPSFAYTMR